MRRRSGFTLVEVLVAMALILFILTILAAAFGAATQTVSDLKSAGDLAEKLRGAANVLKRDLAAPHFADGLQTPYPGPHMSDANFWDRLDVAKNQNPPAGFFRIYETQTSTPEGYDLDNIPIYRQTTASLAYTIALTGTRRSDFLSAVPPGGSPLLSANDALLGPPDQRYADSPSATNPSVYTSQYAEVVVFLSQNPDTTDANGPGGSMPLYGLYRRQFLTTPPHWMTTTNPVVPVAQAPNYLEVSVLPSANEAGLGPNLTFNSMDDLSMPCRRFWMYPFSPSGTYYSGTGYPTMGQSNNNFQAADLLMTDVVSFDVRVLLAGDTEFRDLGDAQVQAYSSNNPSFPKNVAPFVFDTWSNQNDTVTGQNYSTQWNQPKTPASVPLYKNGNTTISIKAIQIQLRVWDYKTKKTRQVTIVQQM